MNDILEVVRDLDLESIYPDDLIESLGLDNLSLEKLLDMLKEGRGKVKYAFDTRLYQNGQEGMSQYHDIGKLFAPVAYALFIRLMSKGEQPRIATYLAVNRYQSSGSHPDTILFWADPDAVVGLYEALNKDGYYENS